MAQIQFTRSTIHCRENCRWALVTVSSMLWNGWFGSAADGGPSVHSWPLASMARSKYSIGPPPGAEG